MGAPWFPLYAADFLVDAKVCRLGDAEFRLLMLCWCRCCLDGSIPSDLKELARILGIHGNRARILREITVDFFSIHPENPNQLISERMTKNSDRYQSIVERNRANGPKGGRPRKPSGLCLDNPDGTEPQLKDKEVPPLPPKGGAAKQRIRRMKPELDIAPENQEQFNLVWEAWPTVHPVTQEEVHKGSKAQAERAFQRIISSGEACARELKVSGILYAKAERYGEATQLKVYQAWDHRNHAIMHVASFFGPEKRPYRQLLELARQEIAKVDAKGAA